MKTCRWVLVLAVIALLVPRWVWALENSLETSFYYKGDSPEELDRRIEEYKRQNGDPPDTDFHRVYLASLLISKALQQKHLPYEENAALFEEAQSVAPENFWVHYYWGRALDEAGNYEEAVLRYEDALSIDDSHVVTHWYLGLALKERMLYDQALGHLEIAYETRSDNANLVFSIGMCLFELKRYDEAIATWEKALRMSTDPKEREAVEKLIAKAKAQGSNLDSTTEFETLRFVVHFAGNSEERIGEKILDTLDEIYDSVTYDLMIKPRSKISLIFFLEEDFYKDNNANAWVGGLARKEKILLPLTEKTYQVESIKGLLAHEFTHTLVNLRTNNNCPTWLNEGLAVCQQFKITNGDLNVPSASFQRIFDREIKENKQYLSLQNIEINSKQTHLVQITLSYLQSYLAVRYFISRWGWAGIDELLQALGEGRTIEEAIHQATNLSFASFESDFSFWVSKL